MQEKKINKSNNLKKIVIFALFSGLIGLSSSGGAIPEARSTVAGNMAVQITWQKSWFYWRNAGCIQTWAQASSQVGPDSGHCELLTGTNMQWYDLTRPWSWIPIWVGNNSAQVRSTWSRRSIHGGELYGVIATVYLLTDSGIMIVSMMMVFVNCRSIASHDYCPFPPRIVSACAHKLPHRYDSALYAVRWRARTE